MPSHNLETIQFGDLQIMGYSVAGEETLVAIPQLDVCFDVGKAPDQIISINHILLTHGHMDHAAGFAYYLSHRHFNGQTPGTVVAPKNMIAPMERILDAWAHLDGTRIPANLVGVAPGDEYAIKPNLFARVFPVNHCQGAVGYCVIEKRKRLKPEYTQLTGPQIVELKKQGIEIEYAVEIPIVTYLGDTQFADFAQLDYIANSRILITECTFFEDEHQQRAAAGNHLFVRDFVNLVQQLNNKHIVVIHNTQRTGTRQIKQILQQNLPASIWDKVVLLMDRHKEHTVTE